MDSPQRLPMDVTIRQCLLEFGDPRVADLRVDEIDPNNLTLFIDPDHGSQSLQRLFRRTTTAEHHTQCC